MHYPKLIGVPLVLLLGACQPETESTTAPAEIEPTTVAAEATDAIACETVDGITPVCGFRNPEDLVVVPGGEAILVSEMAPFMADTPSTLSLLDLGAMTRETIEFDWAGTGEIWGDPACAAPDAAKFSPHGIDLVTRADGRHAVLAVNHGDEQIEFFEIAGGEAGWSLTWMGCAKPPGDPFINDVAGLTDGGFFATHMWDKSTPFDTVVERLTGGVATGWLWEWQPATGFRQFADTEALMPNGIAVNAANTKVYVNDYMGNQHIVIDRESEAVDTRFEVRQPDNVVVDVDGSIWIASHLNEPVDGRCEDDHVGPCLLPFEIVRVDPTTLVPEVILTHRGEPAGYVTVALPHDGRLYMGTANGDRVASVALTK